MSVARAIAPLDSARSCPDCAAVRLGILHELVPTEGTGCAMPCAALDAGAAAPDAWYERFAYAVVRRGILVRERIDPRGEHYAVDMAGPGCVVPFDRKSDSSLTTSRAATRVLLCLRPKDAKTLPGEALDLVEVHRHTIDRLERLADARGRSTAKAKVAALLCALADTMNLARHDAPIPSDLKQRDLAAVLNVRHETVCRVLRQLERGGLIGRSAEGIVILDRDRLEAV